MQATLLQWKVISLSALITTVNHIINVHEAIHRSTREKKRRKKKSLLCLNDGGIIRWRNRNVHEVSHSILWHALRRDLLDCDANNFNNEKKVQCYFASVELEHTQLSRGHGNFWSFL